MLPPLHSNLHLTNEPLASTHVILDVVAGWQRGARLCPPIQPICWRHVPSAWVPVAQVGEPLVALVS
eukprot:5733753-Prymnesium_polylepis.1